MSGHHEVIFRLIEEVEKRPALYSKWMKEYSDSNLRRKLWGEICVAVIEDWHSLSPTDKLKEGAILQRKWYNLRTCFARELRAQKAAETGLGPSKHQKYMYFDRLLFILPDTEQGQRDSNNSPVDVDLSDKTNEEVTLDYEEVSPKPQPIIKSEVICESNDSKRLGMVSHHELILLLIDEVEKRPALYLKWMKEYSDSSLRKKLWDDICVAVIKDWYNLSPEEKFKQGTILQKKWYNVRSCFSKELRAQKAEASGLGLSDHQKYKHFDRLLFLLPDTEQGLNESNISPVNVDIDEEADEEVTSDDEEVLPVEMKDPFEEELVLVPEEDKSTCQPPVDEHTNFALSLIPTLRSLPEEHKLQARIEILGVLQKYRFSSPPTWISTPSSSHSYQENHNQPSTSAITPHQQYYSQHQINTPHNSLVHNTEYCQNYPKQRKKRRQKSKNVTSRRAEVAFPVDQPTLSGNSDDLLGRIITGHS